MSQQLDSAVRSLRSNLLNMTNDRSLALTNELVTEVNGIINGLDSLKLYNMFLAQSNEFNSKFNQNNLVHGQYSNFRFI
jgi:hypothetical protein